MLVPRVDFNLYIRACLLITGSLKKLPRSVNINAIVFALVLKLLKFCLHNEIFQSTLLRRHCKLLDDHSFKA